MADFFLDAIDEDGPGFRGAVQAGCEVIPLIDRVAAFQAMERAILAAKRSVHFSAWVFIADAPLQDSGVKSAIGGSTWLDLFEFVADRRDAPVQVRILLSDPDPVLDPRLHRASWQAVADLAQVRSRLSASNATGLQFFPSRHPATIGKALLSLLGLTDFVKERLEEIVRDYNGTSFADALSLYKRTPGHWMSIKPNARRRRFALSSAPRNLINFGMHHQKLCIVDSEVAFCGGMDVTDLALNDRAHKLKRRVHDRRQVDLLWHDIHCQVRGPAVFDIERNFVERWAREAQLFANSVPEFAAHLPDGATLPAFFFEIGLAQSAPPPRPIGPSLAQVQRTVSVAGKSGLAAIADPAASVFDTIRSDIAEGYERAIAEAVGYIYFENQYFRSRRIANALIARRAQNPALKVIVVLPVAPEELTDEDRGNPIVLQPIALQNEIIGALKSAFGADIGFFSLVAPIRATRASISNEAGSPQIYVHSKICIVDDLFALIGSANANGRGFELDTELNIAWLDAALKVGAFRIDLWSELLGVSAREIAKWKVLDLLAKWRAIAARNLRQAPRLRSGFVIPHDESKFEDLTGPFALLAPLEVLLSIAEFPREPVPAEGVAPSQALPAVS